MASFRKLVVVGLVVAGAFATTRPAAAQFPSAPAQQFASSYYGNQAGISFNAAVSSGFNGNYGYNPYYSPNGYAYTMSNYPPSYFVNRPLTYNNINGTAGMVGRVIGSRGISSRRP